MTALQETRAVSLNRDSVAITPLCAQSPSFNRLDQLLYRSPTASVQVDFDFSPFALRENVK